MLSNRQMKVLQFLRSNEEGRDELENFVRKSGIWDEVSNLNINRLKRYVEDETLDKRIRKGLLKFAEEIEKISIKLIKKKVEEVDL